MANAFGSGQSQWNQNLAQSQMAPMDFSGQSNLLAQRNIAAQQAAQNAPLDPNSAAGKAQAAHDKLFGLATNRLSQLQGDTTDQMVLSGLQRRSQSGAGPYDETTINALKTGADAQAQQGERNALAQLGKTGLQPGDPAYQSAVSEIMARRQGANQQASLGINQQANVANYSSQGQALGQLGGFNQMRNQGITNASQYLGGLYAADTYRQPEQFNNMNGMNQAYWNQMMQSINALGQQRNGQQGGQNGAQGQQQDQQQGQQQGRPGGYSNSTNASYRLQGPAAPTNGSAAYAQQYAQPAADYYSNSPTPSNRLQGPAAYGTYNPNLPVY